MKNDSQNDSTKDGTSETSADPISNSGTANATPLTDAAEFTMVDELGEYWDVVLPEKMADIERQLAEVKRQLALSIDRELELEKELAEARKDSERLDWLEAMPVKMDDWSFWIEVGKTSYRRAIDTAMKETETFTGPKYAAGKEQTND